MGAFLFALTKKLHIGNVYKKPLNNIGNEYN